MIKSGNPIEVAGFLQIISISIFCSVFIFSVGSFLNLIIKRFKNRARPIVIEDAIVVSKRSQISRRRMNNSTAYRTVVRYYVTFQFEDGNKEEFLVSDNSYEPIAEGDSGKIKYQGTDFISFVRNEETPQN